MNENRTVSNSDTNLTQPRSPAVPNSLLTARTRYGANTPAGHGCSNLNEQLLELPRYVRPSWATHPTQTLQANIAWQADRQASLSAKQED